MPASIQAINVEFQRSANACARSRCRCASGAARSTVRTSQVCRQCARHMHTALRRCPRHLPQSGSPRIANALRLAGAQPGPSSSGDAVRCRPEVLFTMRLAPCHFGERTAKFDRPCVWIGPMTTQLHRFTSQSRLV